MKCEICKKTTKDITECIECSSMFCENCGEQKRERCNICMQFEEDLDNKDSSSN
jgi:hypothetical protein